MTSDKDIYWQNDKTPASFRYQDIYYSDEDGRAESRYVFLDAIDAPEIWQNRDHFCLLENGFGTGLNFILTCQMWLKSAPAHARLTYIATEKHPLSRENSDRALSFWPEIEMEKQEFLAHYPPAIPGFHSRNLFDGRVKLLLLIGESAEMLAQLEAKVDAFYLDGFAPRRNPDMWSEAVFTQISRLAVPAARLATFTAAGLVRRGLTRVGFLLEKTNGFGKKRHMLRGRYNGPAAREQKPWFSRPAPLSSGKRIAIIGGGIAGLCAGYALQQRGYHITIYERDDKTMNRASGNRAAILDPYLGKGIEGDFYRTALAHALDFYRKLDARTFLDRGLTKYTDKGEIYFPDCGALSPAIIREILSAKLTIKAHMNIEKFSDCKSADAIIICGGEASNIFPETARIPLTPVRGQVTYLDAADKTSPAQTLCGTGYLTPLEGGNTLLAGSTFNRDDTDSEIRESDHRENIENARKLWPDVTNMPVTGGRAAIRAMSLDHLPICGPVPDFPEFKKAYTLLKHGPAHQDFPPAPYQPDLYMLTALGARGFMTAPLSGEFICAMMSGDPLPLPRQIYHSLHPARFLIRDLIKGI